MMYPASNNSGNWLLLEAFSFLESLLTSGSQKHEMFVNPAPLSGSQPSLNFFFKFNNKSGKLETPEKIEMPLLTIKGQRFFGT